MPHRKVDIVPEKGKKRAHQPPRPWQHSEISVGSHAVTAQARSVRDREERKSAWTWAHGSFVLQLTTLPSSAAARAPFFPRHGSGRCGPGMEMKSTGCFDLCPVIHVLTHQAIPY